MAIDTTKKVKKITVDGTEMELTGGVNKLPQVMNKTVVEISYNDLNGATNIPNYAFQDCIYLTDISIPDSVVSLGIHIFSGCVNLSKVSLGQNIEIIESFMFRNCTSLTNITIPERVTKINNYAFGGCYILNNVIIPRNVETIGLGAFNDCAALTTMTILATTPPTLANNAISSTTTTIYIPAGTLSAYQTATNWSSHASKFVELAE